MAILDLLVKLALLFDFDMLCNKIPFEIENLKPAFSNRVDRSVRTPIDQKCILRSAIVTTKHATIVYICAWSSSLKT